MSLASFTGFLSGESAYPPLPTTNATRLAANAEPEMASAKTKTSNPILFIPILHTIMLFTLIPDNPYIFKNRK